jgi:hypothetical protein
MGMVKPVMGASFNTLHDTPCTPQIEAIRPGHYNTLINGGISDEWDWRTTPSSFAKDRPQGDG